MELLRLTDRVVAVVVLASLVMAPTMILLSRSTPIAQKIVWACVALISGVLMLTVAYSVPWWAARIWPERGSVAYHSFAFVLSVIVGGLFVAAIALPWVTYRIYLRRGKQAAP
jgi:hypothetical protein